MMPQDTDKDIGREHQHLKVAKPESALVIPDCELVERSNDVR